jgi:hypothetical protein
MCTGFGPRTYTPQIPGMGSFAGEAHRTVFWAHGRIDLSSKRGGVIGSGASGVSVLQEAAGTGAQVTQTVSPLPISVRLGRICGVPRLQARYLGAGSQDEFCVGVGMAGQAPPAIWGLGEQHPSPADQTGVACGIGGDLG